MQQPCFPREPAIRAGSVLLAWSALYVVFFSPVLFSGRLLAPGDAGTQYMPLFYSGPATWDPLLQGGWPLAAEPQSLAWYPLAAILRQLPHGWNLFVVSGYVVASATMCTLVHALTGSRFASTLSGLVYGLGSCLVARLGHTVIVHAAAWIPLALLATWRMRQTQHPAWTVIGSLAVALTYLGGQPQVLAQTLPVLVAWALVCALNPPPAAAPETTAPSSPLTAPRFLVRAGFSIGCGCALASAQIVPAIELAAQTSRSSMGFEEFVSFAMPVVQVPTLLFPWLFGGFPGGHPYFGEANLAELSGYVGVLPLALAAVGFVKHRPRSVAWFWGLVAVLAFLLALGDATPVARWAYHLPNLNRFRCPGRHLLEFSLALAILAGLGSAALERGTLNARLVVATAMATAAVVLIAAAGVHSQIPWLSSLSESRDAGPIANPLRGAEIGLPLAMLGVAVAVLLLWARWRTSPAIKALLLMAVVADLSSYSWFAEWKAWAPGADITVAPRSVARLRDALNARHQRILSVRGVRGAPGLCPPNLSRLWGVPSLNGYTQLMLTSTRSFVGMSTDGNVEIGSRPLTDLSLDLMGVRYLFAPSDESFTFSQAGMAWARAPLTCSVGTAPGQSRLISLRLPRSVRATSLGVVSALRGSASIPQDMVVAHITVSDDHGGTATCDLRAGCDTGEWAFDCPDVRPACRHRRPRVFDTHPAPHANPPFHGHEYVGSVPLSAPTNVRTIDVHWTPATGAIDILRLTLVDGARGRTWPVSPLLVALEGSFHWRRVLDNPEACIYENLRVMPRAWRTRRVITTSPDQALRAVIAGRLPDGAPFDPRATALVEAPIDVATPPDPTARTSVEFMQDGLMQVRTQGAHPALLVTSDVHYDGWKVFVDGGESRLCRVDFLLRGVVVPAGEHVVQFVYTPRSLELGMGVTAAAFMMLALVGWTGLGHPRRPRHGPGAAGSDPAPGNFRTKRMERGRGNE